MPVAADNSPSEQPASAANPGGALHQKKPPRPPVERAIVWTLILALLLVVSWQWYARNSYSRTLTALDARVDTMRNSIVKEKAEFEREKTEKGLNWTYPEIMAAVRERMTPAAKVSEIDQYIYGLPTVTVTEAMSSGGPMRRETYVWRGLFQNYELYLNYEVGDDPYLYSVDSKHE